MSNLKIKDIETLEILSLDELNHVVGGRGRGKPKWFDCHVTNATSSNVTF